MMQWIHEQLAFLEDPYTLIIAAPVLFGVVYIVTSFFGERG